MRKQEDIRGGLGRRTPTPTPSNVNNANSNVGVLALLQSVCSGDNPEGLARQLRLPQVPAKNGIKSCACIVHLILLQVNYYSEYVQSLVNHLVNFDSYYVLQKI